MVRHRGWSPDKGKGRPTYRLSPFIKTSDGNLEHPFAAEPCRSRTDLASDRSRNAPRRISEGIDERGARGFPPPHRGIGA